MARCELTGKGPVVVNLVSHSNIKTKSRSQPNVQLKRLYSDALNEMIGLKVATSTIRSIDHVGNFDKFLLQQDEKALSQRALAVKRRVQKCLVGKLKRTGATKSATTKSGAKS